MVPCIILYSMNNQQMQLYAVNFVPLLGSLYMFRVFYTPIIRSTIYNYLQPLVQTTVSTQLLTPSVACRPRWVIHRIEYLTYLDVP